MGISDMDPVRWPGSKWRCLMVWICGRACLSFKHLCSVLRTIMENISFGYPLMSIIVDALCILPTLSPICFGMNRFIMM